MKDLKKQQHYVWKHYLKPWTINDKIWCQRNGSTFNTSLKNIAQKRYFYESEQLNSDELAFLKYILNGMHPTAQESLNGLLKLYNFTADSNGYIKKCGIEDFHSIIESNFIPILDKLYLEDLSFFENEKEKNAFAYFIGSQYTRTNKMRDNMIKANLKTTNLNPEKLSKVFNLIFADTIGNWIFSKTKTRLLINNSDIDFITGDQPVLNTMGNHSYTKAPEKIELYYPISPKYAIYISEKLDGKVYISKDDVIKYNEFIKNHSKEQLYSKKENDF